MGRPKIQDEYTHLPVSRQRKEQLRHPERYKERRQRWEQSEAGRASIQRKNARQVARTKLAAGVDKRLDVQRG